MANLKRTPEQVEKAVKGSGGILATIARRLKVHRHTVHRYLFAEEYAQEYAAARQLYSDECELVGDAAEDNIVKAIKKGDLEISKWYARMKLRDRGYVDTMQLNALLEGVKAYVGISPDDWDEAPENGTSEP